MQKIIESPYSGKKGREVQRSSNIELFRIISMLVIIAQHYVVNSGMLEAMKISNKLTVKSIFLLLFGCGGKIAINGFVVITGYFMCRSNITAKKYVKLFCEVLFYKIIIYIIFIISGYQSFGIKTFVSDVFPINELASGFTSAFLVFYLFIPFLNILIRSMDKKQHTALMLLSVAVYSIWGTLPFTVIFNYVTWFSVLYIIGSWISLYPLNWFESSKATGTVFFISLFISLSSVLCCTILDVKFLGNTIGVHSYYFVADSNKILALFTGISGFMWFKTLNIKYSKFINKIAAASFGVLLIHANSDTMRKWLWKDILKNTEMFKCSFAIMLMHALCSVAVVYIICAVIDILRIKFIEIPFMKLYETKIDIKLKNNIKKLL